LKINNKLFLGEKMNTKTVFSKMIGLCFLCLIFGNCSSTPFNKQQAESDFLSVKDILEQVTPIALRVGIQLSENITTNDPHLFIPVINYRTAMKLLEIESLEQGIDYKITIRGFAGGWWRGYILIPKLDIYDSDFNNLPIRQESGKTMPPGWIDPVSFLTEYTFTTDKTGKLYFLVSGDMTSQQGVTIKTINQNGGIISSYLQRSPYSKFKIRIEPYK
jgi:hypothetical protein